MSNQRLLLPLKHACQEFTQLILSLSAEQFLSPMDGWAPRDVVAHLVGWNGLMIEASLSILAGKLPAYYADAGNDYSNINAGFTAQHASRSMPELLAELKSSMDKFESFISSQPSEELVADHGVIHHSKKPATIAMIIDSLAGDYRYHTRQIKDWLGGNIP
jgi:hypothetical protein